MKILHVISSLRVGGAETALCNFLECAASANPGACSGVSELKNINFPTHRVPDACVGEPQSIQLKGNEHIVAFFHDGPCRKKIEALGIKTYCITGWLYRYDLGAYICLKKIILSFKPDVIHSALWAANILSRILASRCCIPVICDLHGNCVDEGRFRNLLDRLTARKAYAIVAVGKTVLEAYRHHVYNHPSLIMIQNGINVALVKKRALENPLSREEFGIPRDAFVIGAVGRLEPIKSYDVLINAFALSVLRQQNVSKGFKSAHVLIVGDGSERKNLETLCQTLGIKDHVLFVGMRSDAQRFYPLFDCFALSSHSEGLSIALLEALCFGLPVITTHAFSQHDVITHGINGFLITPNDIYAYAKHLEIFYNNRELREAMREANTLLVEKQFSLDATVSAYISLYQKACASRL